MRGRALVCGDQGGLYKLLPNSCPLLRSGIVSKGTKGFQDSHHSTGFKEPSWTETIQKFPLLFLGGGIHAIVVLKIQNAEEPY